MAGNAAPSPSLFRPDGGDVVQASRAVTADQFQPIALGDQLVKSRLVLGRRQAVTCLPGRSPGDLTEDRGVTVHGAITVAADHDWLVALARYLVEERLV